YGRPEIFNTDQGRQFTSDDFTGTLKRHGVMISMDGKSLPSRKRGAAAWTTSSSSGCGAASNTRKSTSMPMRALPRPRLGLAPGSASTTTNASIRALVTARRGKSIRKAYGYVDDRLRRPAALPPLPEQARKAGKCSPSPTYPQAPQPMKDLILMKCTIGSPNQPSRSLRPEPTSKPAGLHLKTRLRLSHKRGPLHGEKIPPYQPPK